MRKMMMMVGAAMMSASSFAVETSNVTPFEDVRVNVPVRVRFVQGDSYKVDVESEDTVAASGIRVSVKDGVLKISSIDANETQSEVFITIMSPKQPKLSVGRNMEMKPATRGKGKKTAE